jgi:hypothetical protein
MPITNLNNVHYTTAEKTEIAAGLKVLEALLNPKFKNLTPEERQKYGSVSEQNKLIINKVFEYTKDQPNLSSPDVDWEEFQSDYESRAFIESVIAKLQNLIKGLDNNKILHDFDNYHAALTDYGYSQYKTGTSTPGFETKANDIAQFFSRSNTSTSTPKTPPPSSN